MIEAFREVEFKKEEIPDEKELKRRFLKQVATKPF